MRTMDIGSMQSIDMNESSMLIETKTFKNPHPFLFVSMDCIEPIFMGAHYLTDCSHDSTQTNNFENIFLNPLFCSNETEDP